MKINGKDVICFKVFVSPRCFMVHVFNEELNHKKVYEISEETENTEEYILNVIKDILNCFSYKGFIFCGYNNVHYDNAFINMLFSKQKFYTMAGVDTKFMLNEFNELNSYIINNEYDKWKEYKYGKFFNSFDLMMMNFSKKERISLQEVKFSLNMNSILSPKDMSTMAGHQAALANDVEAIMKLLNRSKEMIDLRLELSKEYNIGTLSLDDVSLGKRIFSTIFTKNTGTTLKDYKKPDTPKTINLKDIIFDDIKFYSITLRDFLEKLKQKSISVDNPELEERFSVYGSDLSFGLGGLHSIEQPRIYTTDPWRVIVQIDAESMYPNIVTNRDIYPSFLGDSFFNAYNTMLGMRLKAKNEGKKMLDKMLKRILVATVGMFNSPNEPMYDPVSFYKITINGQLLLLMLAEKLFFQFNAKFINWNTDGIFIEMNRYSLSQLQNLLREFDKDHDVHFVTSTYVRMYQLDGNNYFALKDAWDSRKARNITNFDELIVGKGMFKEPGKTLKATNGSVIAKAVMGHLLFNKSLESIIQETQEKNKYAFMYFSKVPESYRVYYGSINLGNSNRFYYAKGGYALTKVNLENNSTSLISDKGHPVIIANVDRDMKDINLSYYVNQANTIVARLKFIQLKLF